MNVSGSPKPKVTWYKNNEELTSANGRTIETKEGSSRLTIKGVSGQTSGTFVVKAENTAGSATAEFTVVVKGTVFGMQFFIRIHECKWCHISLSTFQMRQNMLILA